MENEIKTTHIEKGTKIIAKNIFGLAVVIVIVVFLYFHFFQNTSTENLKWTNVNTGLATLNVNTVSDVNQNILYAGTDEGIFKSINGGESWFAVNNGLPNPTPDIYKIIYTPNNVASEGNDYFALDTGGELFETVDGGNNWLLRGESVADIAISPDVGYGTKSYEAGKIYILMKSPMASQYTKNLGDSLLFYTPNWNPFFSSPDPETEKSQTGYPSVDVMNFYKDSYSNPTSLGNMNVQEINFLAPASATDKTAEDAVGILTQNSNHLWLLTNKTIYLCDENGGNCAEQTALSNGNEENISKMGYDFSKHSLNPIGYSQYGDATYGIPHIYINDGGSFLVKQCLYQGNDWIENNSLSKLGYLPEYTYVYNYNYDGYGTTGGICYSDEKKDNWGQDVIFTVATNNKNDSENLLVSADGGENWKIFKNLPDTADVNSISVKHNYNDSGYDSFSVFLATNNGIYKTDISFEIFGNKI